MNKKLADKAPVKKRENTIKQDRFISEYLIDGNASRAALAAGYSPQSAPKIGFQLLEIPRIAATINKRQQLLATKCETTAAGIMRELEDLQRKSLEAGQMSAAIRAAELRGKHIGMFVERVEQKTELSGGSNVHIYLPEPKRGVLGAGMVVDLPPAAEQGDRDPEK